ncbi:hypothetical protein E6P97_02580 [Patescibacteria group bacterium]|nr:MAG: hypothetical protein E6P97_02580 [Patescibacteria group bacterium]
MKYVYDQGVVKRSVARLVLGVAAFVLISQAFSGVLYTRSARAEGSTSSAIVYQDDFANSMTTWTYQNDNTSATTPDPTSEHEIVARPGGSTQSNNGAVKLQGATTGSRWNLASLQYSGQKISEITSLGFDLRTSNPGSAYINLDVDFNHAGISGWQGRLVYVPTGVVANAWGSYDAVANGDGLWKWSRMWGTSPMTAWPDGITAEARTWNEI